VPLLGLKGLFIRRKEECSLRRHYEKKEEMPGIPSPSPLQPKTNK
jgi:hypothetical protein